MDGRHWKAISPVQAVGSPSLIPLCCLYLASCCGPLCLTASVSLSLSLPALLCMALSVSLSLLFLVSLYLVSLIHPLSFLSASPCIFLCLSLLCSDSASLSLCYARSCAPVLFLSGFCLSSSPSPSAFAVSPLPCHPVHVGGGNRPGGGECHGRAGPGEGRTGQWTRGYCKGPGKSLQGLSPVKATG